MSESKKTVSGIWALILFGSIIAFIFLLDLLLH